MQQRVSLLGQALVAGLLVVALALGYWQVLRAGELAAAGGNPRVVEAERRALRGRILDRNGQVLAENRQTPEGNVRVYPAPAAAPVVGYHSTRFGTAGLEARYTDLLRGERSADPVDRLARDLFGLPTPGNDLVLTLDLRLQQAALEQLAGRPGAIVALDPRTGAVLALASAPTFDPNHLAAELERLRNDPSGALLNRAVQGRYTPGSTFKIVTAAAAIDLGLAELDRPFACTQQMELGGLRVDCRNHPHLAQVTFRQAFAWSCNRTFALTGLQLGLPGPLKLADGLQTPPSWEENAALESAPVFEEYARRFGFGRSIPFDLEVASSQLKGANRPWSPALLGQTAFGQGELLVSPLHLALVAGAVANGGVMVQPYLAVEARSPNGHRLPLHEPGTQLSFPVKAETAARLNELLELSVREAYAQKAQIAGVRVAGKTGTAEVGPPGPHAWFVGYAPADRPRIVVAVVLEHAGSGADVATPVGRAILEEGLRLTQ